MAAALAAVAMLTAVLAAAPAEAEEPTTWFVDESKLPFDPLPDIPAEQHWGILDGAGYRVEVPAEWNGDLVMWAHGYRGEGFELTVDNIPIRQHVLEQGYAWAASSYAQNSYNIRTGVDSTKALVDYVNAMFLDTDADQVFLMGASMGGHITAVSIEEHHRVYDGALPICGVLGGFELFDFFLDYTVVSQQLTLGESHFPVEPGEWFGTTVPAIKDELGAAPGSFPFLLSDTGEEFKTFMEWQTGGPRPNYDEAFVFWHGFATATGFGNFFFDLGTGDGSLANSNGLSVIDNTTTTYKLDDDPTDNSPAERALNRDVARVAFEKGARSNGEGITGKIRDRVLSLHNLGDLFVPFSMEIDYARKVRDEGRSNRLVQRAIRGVGHCDFTDYELTTAFDDLIAWVETGVRPAGDDVLRRSVVASPTFGCRFSDPDHTLHTLAVPCT